MKFIVGIDEVGRGSLAGPVTVAAVAAPANGKWLMANGRLGKLRDSKKLSAKRREAWFEYLHAHPKIDYALACVYPRQIERRNISGATNLAALRAARRLFENCLPAEALAQAGKFPGLRSRSACFGGAGKIENCRIYLDGGLFLGNGDQPKNARTVIKGDEKIKVIAAASIIAKVSRDRGMARLAKKYPRYGFEIHKGYGTKKHMAAIRKYGPSKAHRLTFLRSC